MKTPPSEDAPSEPLTPDSDLSDLDPKQRARAQATRARVKAYLASIPERNRQILEYKFGFVGDREHTLQETGDVFGISRQRVHQIIAQAKEKALNH